MKQTLSLSLHSTVEVRHLYGSIWCGGGDPCRNIDHSGSRRLYERTMFVMKTILIKQN